MEIGATSPTVMLRVAMAAFEQTVLEVDGRPSADGHEPAVAGVAVWLAEVDQQARVNSQLWMLGHLGPLALPVSMVDI